MSDDLRERMAAAMKAASQMRLALAGQVSFDAAAYAWDAVAEDATTALAEMGKPAPLEKAVEAGIDVSASLAAAISLLERGGKKAAPSDKMFAQMLADYNASLDRARATLAELTGDKNE